jgi:putative SOS response-associated peptidase YedK
MCGRFTLRTPLALLAQRFLFDLHSAEEAAAALSSAAGTARDESYLTQARYNVAPTQQIAAVRSGDKQREFAWLRWGLIPSWSKDTKIASSTINARSETAPDKPAFRSAFKSRRCLILADGYFEWIKDGKQKLPIYYRRRDDQPFAFAGLWETWQGPDRSFAEPWQTGTILTTAANELAAPVHDRMPAILQPADYNRWLDPANTNRDELLSLLQPFPADAFQATRVNPIVNSPRNQGPECIAEVKELF